MKRIIFVIILLITFFSVSLFGIACSCSNKQKDKEPSGKDEPIIEPIEENEEIITKSISELTANIVEIKTGDQIKVSDDKSNYIWTSQDKSIAFINKGIIVGCGAGTTIINVTDGENFNEEISIKVLFGSILVPTVSFDTSERSVTKGDELVLTPKILADGKEYEAEFTYKSSDESKIKVNNGKIIALDYTEENKPVEILISINCYGWEDQIALLVNVIEDVDFWLNKNYVEIYCWENREGDTWFDTVYVDGLKYNGQEIEKDLVEWTIEDDKIASFDKESGTIVALNEGKTILTAIYTTPTGFKAKSEVRVNVIKATKFNVSFLLRQVDSKYELNKEYDETLEAIDIKNKEDYFRNRVNLLGFEYSFYEVDGDSVKVYCENKNLVFTKFFYSGEAGLGKIETVEGENIYGNVVLLQKYSSTSALDMAYARRMYLENIDTFANDSALIVEVKGEYISSLIFVAGNGGKNTIPYQIFDKDNKFVSVTKPDEWYKIVVVIDKNIHRAYDIGCFWYWTGIESSFLIGNVIYTNKQFVLNNFEKTVPTSVVKLSNPFANMKTKVIEKYPYYETAEGYLIPIGNMDSVKYGADSKENVYIVGEKTGIDSADDLLNFEVRGWPLGDYTFFRIYIDNEADLAKIKAFTKSGLGVYDDKPSLRIYDKNLNELDELKTGEWITVGIFTKNVENANSYAYAGFETNGQKIFIEGIYSCAMKDFNDFFEPDGLTIYNTNEYDNLLDLDS